MANEVNYVEDEPCPQCGGLRIILHEQAALWECEKCSLVWGAIVKRGYFIISRYNENENQAKSEEKL